jgi:hypothetical protein
MILLDHRSFHIEEDQIRLFPLLAILYPFIKYGNFRSVCMPRILLNEIIYFIRINSTRNSQFYKHTYHSRLIPEGIKGRGGRAEVSQ